MTAGLEALLVRWTTLEAETVHAIARLAAITVTAVLLLLAYRLALRVITRLLRLRSGHEPHRTVHADSLDRRAES